MKTLKLIAIILSISFMIASVHWVFIGDSEWAFRNNVLGLLWLIIALI